MFDALPELTYVPATFRWDGVKLESAREWRLLSTSARHPLPGSFDRPGKSPTGGHGLHPGWSRGVQTPRKLVCFRCKTARGCL